MSESQLGFELRFKKNQEEFKFTLDLILNTKFPGWITERKEKKINILSIGYGAAPSEFGVLAEIFPESELYGMDIALEALNEQNIRLVSNQEIPNLHIKTANAGVPDSYIDENGKPLTFDLIVVRSPDVHSGGWDKVMKESWEHLNEGGVIYVTSNTDSEAKGIREQMKNASIPIQETANTKSHARIHSFPETNITFAQKPASTKKNQS